MIHILYTTISPDPRLYIDTTGSSAAWTNGIRTQCLHYEGQEAKAILLQNAEHDEQRTIMDQNPTTLTHHQHRTDRTRAPLWHKDECVSSHVQTALPYWKEMILATHQPRLIWDARCFNSVCKHFSFHMDESSESRPMLLERGTASPFGP